MGVTSIVDLGALDGLTLPDIDENAPGLALAVVIDGDLVWSTARGRTNHDADSQPLDTTTSFYVASVAKQITAAAVALLIDDGRIDPDQSFCAYLPELPCSFDTVVVTDLVHHISGVPSLEDQLGRQRDRDWWLGLGTWDMIALICDIDELAAPAGSVYRYANEGYLLLAAIIERTTNMGVNEFVSQRIFAPLNMTRSWYRDSPDAPMADATGHTITDGTLERDDSAFHFVGDGGLVTTVENLASWAGVHATPYRLGRSVASRLTKQGQLRNGQRLHYAWGISVRPHHGRTIHSHGGQFVGNLAKIVQFPGDPAITFICLANRGDIDIDALVMNAVNRTMRDSLNFNKPNWQSTLRPDGLR